MDTVGENAELGAGRGVGAGDEVVRRIGHLRGHRRAGIDADPGFAGLLGFDLVLQLQRQGEHVEAGAEVGDRRGDGYAGTHGGLLRVTA